jgi:hypothetical protein
MGESIRFVQVSPAASRVFAIEVPVDAPGSGERMKIDLSVEREPV